MSVRIGLLVQSPALLIGLKTILETKTDWKVIWEYGEKSLLVLPQPGVGILFVYLSLSQRSWNSQISEIRKNNQDAAIVLVIDPNSLQDFEQAELSQLGIRGIIFTNASVDFIKLCVTVASSGNGSSILVQPGIEIRHEQHSPARKSPRSVELTPREREVLKLLAEGCSIKKIASELGISTKTAEAHKFNLMKKLDIHNKAILVQYAMVNGIIKIPVQQFPIEQAS